MIAETNHSNLTGNEISKIIDVCNGLHHADSGQSFLRHCQNEMDTTFGYVHHSTEIYRLDPFALAELENPTVESHMLDVFNHYVTDHPYVELMLGDTPSHLDYLQQNPAFGTFRKSALYNEFYDKVQGQNLLWFAYRSGNEMLSCAYLRDAEFNDRELSMAKIIYPHIGTAWKNWKRTRKLKEELAVLKKADFLSVEEDAASARLRKNIDALTSRQHEVVEHLAAGMDNQQIADEMKISILTVKKHLQAVFQSMDVQHRTELAAKWHQAHSILLH